jgi:hypothetical protein
MLNSHKFVEKYKINFRNIVRCILPHVRRRQRLVDFVNAQRLYHSAAYSNDENKTESMHPIATMLLSGFDDV